MIKPLEDYSPEDRAFLASVQQLRDQPPKPSEDPGPIDFDEIQALLARIPQEDRDELFEAMQGRDR